MIRIRGDKRGLSQVEWAISLSMFIIYLIWFFIVMRPNLVQTDDPKTLKESLTESLYTYAGHSVKKLPFSVDANMAKRNAPIILEYDWPENYGLGEYYDVYDDKLIFLDDINTSKVYEIVISNDNYSIPYKFFEFTSDITHVQTANMRVDIVDGMLKDASYLTLKRIENMSVHIKDILMEGWTTVYSHSNMSAYYKAVFPLVNHSLLMSAYNNRIDGFVKGDAKTRITFDIFGYDTYYSDYFNNGPIGCEQYFQDYVSFYDGFNSLSIRFDQNVSIDVCGANETATVTFELNSSSHYVMVFHEDENGRLWTAPYRLNVGVEIPMRGVSEKKLVKLLSTDYRTLKNIFNYPDSKDFKIIAFDMIGNASIEAGPDPYEMATVTSEGIGYYILNKDGEYRKNRINVLQW